MNNLADRVWELSDEESVVLRDSLTLGYLVVPPGRHENLVTLYVVERAILRLPAIVLPPMCGSDHRLRMGCLEPGCFSVVLTAAVDAGVRLERVLAQHHFFEGWVEASRVHDVTKQLVAEGVGSKVQGWRRPVRPCEHRRLGWLNVAKQDDDFLRFVLRLDASVQ